MPYKTEKNSDGSYKVVNADTGKVHAKHASKANAEAQMRIMMDAEGKSMPKTTRQMIDHMEGSSVGNKSKGKPKKGSKQAPRSAKTKN